MDNKKTELSFALRVYPEPRKPRPERSSKKTWECPNLMLVFDTETRTDETQRLMFGNYRYYADGRCLEEGLFHADDLSPDELRVMKRYVARNKAATDCRRELRLLTRDEFVNRLYAAAYKSRSLLVGFNLPFDLSRIAGSFTNARRNFQGGFSLGLWFYIDENGETKLNHYRPSVCVKHIDSKRALKAFTTRRDPDQIDKIPEGSETGKPDQHFNFRGQFLDLRTLAFALTDKGYSLKTACETFGVEHGKQEVSQHGVLTDEYIDYNRADVLATAELAYKLLEEYEKHPIPLQVTKAFSPASIGKGYLRAMGILPVMVRQPDFPIEYLGYAQSSFFGGRASAHIRKTVVPVVYTDFLSMYPTGNILVGLWEYLIAQKINVVKNCKKEILTFLENVTADDLFKPETWKYLTGFVKVIPNGEILPTRANYNPYTNDWQVAVNHLYAGDDTERSALWFTLPDVVAAKILTGRMPQIVDAFKIEPSGRLPSLKPTKLRGIVDVDPAKQDFFRIAIEERQRLKKRNDLSKTENERLSKALKVLANATSYGINAEMIRQESEKKINVTCHGIDPDCFRCDVLHPDEPGEFCFPPLASLITGAARLMLALLEHCVTTMGGTYAMEDTDSMAIVATERGGLVPCPGGPYKRPNGDEAVKALSWKQVDEIVDRFGALNPYDRNAVPHSVLKVEDDNRDPATGKQRQLYCLAISAKRYVLFLRDRHGDPVLLRKDINNPTNRWSQHGLGHLLNPSDIDGDDRDWIGHVWLNIARRTLGLTAQGLPFEFLPAVGRVSVSSPAVMKAFTEFNKDKPYAEQIKPFNFALTCQVRQLGHPVGADPKHFHLIAPYDANPQNWLKCDWIDQYSGKTYQITTKGHHGGDGFARVRTYGEILREYENHAELKCADVRGDACGKQVAGLLQRRHVVVDRLVYVGKESNKLEDVSAGMIHTAEQVYTEYCDPRRDEWATKILPALKKAPLPVLIEETGMSRRALIYMRMGNSRPHSKNLELIVHVLNGLGLV